MAKRSRPTAPRIETGTPQEGGARVRKRVKRLEQDLANLAATEARRIEQLTRVQAKMADVRARRAELRAMDAVVGPTVGSGLSPGGHFGYCMREKRRVEIRDPKPVTLSNGRTATAGTCSTCGVRVVALSTRGTPTDA